MLNKIIIYMKIETNFEKVATDIVRWIFYRLVTVITEPSSILPIYFVPLYAI
jgi:hypothetical protein